MMIRPECFVENLKDASYEELIETRDGLIKEMQEYERCIIEGDCSGDEWYWFPQPDTAYEFGFMYLIELLKLMENKYASNGFVKPIKSKESK